MNTALLAEYLAAIHFQPAHPTEADYRRMNQMALQLSMELPDDVLAVLFRPNDRNYQHAWDVVDAVRRHTDMGRRNPEHAVLHASGAGKPMTRQ
jgi:hypothetical protein